MTATAQRDRPVNNRHQWLAHVEAQKKSGLNRTEYCKQYNLSYHAMTYWTHKGYSSPDTKTTLVPVPVKRDSLQYSSKGLQPALRINLSGGISVEVGDNFSASTLTRLLNTLEAKVMFSPANPAQVFIAPGTTDMRKSINGLSILVADQFELDPFSGSLFAFCNRKRDIVKILYWDHSGFCLWHKRLEKDRFLWPETEDGVLNIRGRELAWLLDGLSIDQREAHQRLSYTNAM